MSGKYEYRGISTFIATLLLMVLAVAAGAIIYAYTMGYLGGLGTTKTPGTLSLDSAIAYDGDEDNITAYVRNIGKRTVILEVAYVDGEKFTDLNKEDDEKTVTIPEGEVKEVFIDVTEKADEIGWKAGKTFEVKLVATDGTHLTFNVKVEKG